MIWVNSVIALNLIACSRSGRQYHAFITSTVSDQFRVGSFRHWI